MHKRNLTLFLSVSLIIWGLLALNLRDLSARPSAQAATTAEYRVTFTAEWSAATHPTDFPSGNPHFSGLIGGTHNADISFWAPGAIATDGIEEMAETGGTGMLQSEVQMAIDNGDAGRALAGGGIANSPDTRTMDFFISSDYPLVSIVTMIAPSPDWFVGVHGQSLLNNQGDWVNGLTVSLDPYDAGTDSGSTYRSGNDDTNPRDSISNLRGVAPFFGNSDAHIGTFTFERLDGPADPTDTPAPADTPTDVPPTNTPTPLPPTNTPTPLPPTSTPTSVPPTNTQEPPAEPTTDPATAPSIKILSPENGTTVQQPFSLMVEVKNWSLMNGGKHYHWIVDNFDQGPVFGDTPVTINGLSAGVHTIEVSLSETNHDFIGVSDKITVTLLAAPNPTATPTTVPTDEPTAQPTMPMTTTMPTGTQRSMARYQIIFNSTWSNETHPNANFPGGAHYSPLIGATHNDSVSLWSSGGMASPGIEQMAETGGTNILRTEIQAVIDAGNADQFVTGNGLASTPGTLMSNEFTATAEFPLLSLVTMIAPSPDWFIGVHDYELMDENGEWKRQLVVELLPYDAGTDDGTEYGSPNADSEPQQPITALTGQAPFTAQSLGSFTVSLMETIPAFETTDRVYLPTTY